MDQASESTVPKKLPLSVPILALNRKGHLILLFFLLLLQEIFSERTKSYPLSENIRIIMALPSRRKLFNDFRVYPKPSNIRDAPEQILDKNLDLFPRGTHKSHKEYYPKGIFFAIQCHSLSGWSLCAILSLAERSRRMTKTEKYIGKNIKPAL